MSIQRLEISGLRNLTSVCLDAHPQLNIIDGPNGSGKTSLLEAIFLLGRGRSFRTNKRHSVIQENQACSQLFTRLINRQTIQNQLGLEICRRSRRIRLNGEDVAKSADLAKTLPIQFFNQQSFSLVDQGPAVRRKFVDWGVFHVEPGFFPVWQQYQRALQQRNAALRGGSVDITAWDKECVETAERLNNMRIGYIAELEKAFLQRIGEMLPGYRFSLDFDAGWDTEKTLDAIFVEDSERDTRRGFTHSGPHRADLAFMLDQEPVVERLSRGQQKLFVSALILAQADVYAEASDQPCVIMVDDLTAELDQAHTYTLLCALIKTGAQVFATTTNVTLLGDLSGVPHALFHVKQGDVIAVEVV